MRRIGNTTRLADKYIQDLFTNGTVLVRDHIDLKVMHLYLLRLIRNRLILEHYRDFSTFNKFVVMDLNRYSLTLKDFKDGKA